MKLLAALALLVLAGCTAMQPAQAPSPVASQPAATPASAPPPAAKSASTQPQAASPTPTPPPAATSTPAPAAKAQDSARAETPPAKKPAAPVPAAHQPAPATPTAAAPTVQATAPQAASPAPLDLKVLEQQLKETKAIGLMTKLSLKNQVDDLLAQFHAYYQGQLKATLADLRRPYELLLMKVLAVLQDGDPALAHAINASREAIWGILSDREKFVRATST
jgi:hypothetical protein